MFYTQTGWTALFFIPLYALFYRCWPVLLAARILLCGAGVYSLHERPTMSLFSYPNKCLCTVWARSAGPTVLHCYMLIDRPRHSILYTESSALYCVGPSLRPATYSSRMFSPVSLGFMGWMLGAHGVDKGFPMRKQLTQYERTSRKRTYSVTYCNLGSL